LGRFVLNTTVGIGGLLDPATSAGLSRNQADFGLTLGHWGVHTGPFIEVPILGPSDLRDGAGRVVGVFTTPTHYIHNSYISYGLYLPYFVDERASLLPLDETLKTVFDPYAFIRDAYLARRAYLVSDGKVTNEDLVDPGADDNPAPGGEPPTVPQTAAPATAAPPAAPPQPTTPAEPPPEL
jgi:phospholipid-binding lipoprotein MlaA